MSIRFQNFTPLSPQLKAPEFTVLNPQELYSKLNQISVEIPDYLHELPVPDLQRLASDLLLLKSEIYMNPKFEEIRGQILGVVENLVEFAERLLSEYESLRGRFDEVSLRLGETNASVERLRRLDMELSGSLYKFESGALKQRLQSAILESDQVAQNLVESFKADDSVGDFIKSFRAERKVYHLRKERLERLNEDRVGGLL
ncbi:unnamed protein product [Kuraishia capsulata CBS 1993]|uniref:VPS37 C-terminal domain-containing protein n=1 Tax=Kuraishia capsulata CBS 1993 TaxID=1382522 RepID=W6MID9_9ASCO|nr:uncharacterized protein KUCA_T00000072001 [Kuraishia capsulata CBS 1993]CDK24112.1 unnamed protein product [Kuraishia capsulata CBS 1993]